MAFILANQPAICKKHSPSLKLLATPALILHSIIISFRPAWLARVLLCYKRTQSSGNDNRVKDKRHPLRAKDYMCQSSSPNLPMAVDAAVR